MKHKKQLTLLSEEMADSQLKNSAATPSFLNNSMFSTRLIDDGLMHFEASQAGYAERHSRGETSHTLQVWWARRPHSAMRALVFATLCKKKSKKNIQLLSSLVETKIGEHSILKECEKELLENYGTRPTILDMFGGGGTIPLEGVNIGAQVASIDINELSVFIQKCHLIYSRPDEITRLKKIIAKHGDVVLNKLRDRTSVLYPFRDIKQSTNSKGGPITYFWTYKIKCECGYSHYITRRPWLSKKPGKSIGLSRHQDGFEEKIKIDFKMKDSVRTRVTGFKCPKCDAERKRLSISECEDHCVAMALKGIPSGKIFVEANSSAVPNKDIFDQFEAEILSRTKLSLPLSPIPKWSGIVNPALYGIETHADFMNRRQRAVLLALIDTLLSEYEEIKKNETEADSKFVVGVLSGLIDQLVDWNCRLSMWIPQNEQVGRAFCGPGVAMLWDYAEADPLLEGPANLWAKLERIIEGLDSLSLRRGDAEVYQASASNLPFNNESFDAIVTDPPYYDNIYYSILADFFYSWKKLLLQRIDPILFSSIATANSGNDELVASTIRSGSANKAHVDYCKNLTLALTEAARVLKSDGVMSFVYSHASVGGWVALVQSFRASGLMITSAQPLSIERKARPRAIGSEAVNTCIVFVARKVRTLAKCSNDDVYRNYGKIIKSGFPSALINSGWRSDDVAWALFAQGIGLLSNVHSPT